MKEGQLKQTLNNRDTLKRMITIILLVIALLAIAMTLIYHDFNYARSLEFNGTVVDIQWKTENHQLPKFVILNDANNTIEISHFTIDLNPSVIKNGDKIVKQKGDDFCTINGKKFHFSTH